MLRFLERYSKIGFQTGVGSVTFYASRSTEVRYGNPMLLIIEFRNKEHIQSKRRYLDIKVTLLSFDNIISCTILAFLC